MIEAVISDISNFVHLYHGDHGHTVKKQYYIRSMKKKRSILCQVCGIWIDPEKIVEHVQEKPVMINFNSEKRIQESEQ